MPADKAAEQSKKKKILFVICGDGGCVLGGGGGVQRPGDLTGMICSTSRLLLQHNTLPSACGGICFAFHAPAVALNKPTVGSFPSSSSLLLFAVYF